MRKELDSTSDKALMCKVRDGDLDKLGLLFERYHRRLFAFFYRLTYRTDISEDLVQEVFERILKYRHTYSSDGPFATWIFQIARNLHSDFYHKEKKMIRDNLEENDKNMPTVIPDLPELESAEERKRRWLHKAIEQLDEEKRETLILSRFEGFKYREIAEIMECSESAVKVRIFRAIKDLKNITDQFENKYD